MDTPKTQGEQKPEKTAKEKPTNAQHLDTLKGGVNSAIENARAAGLEVYDIVTALNAIAKKLEEQNPDGFKKDSPKE